MPTKIQMYGIKNCDTVRKAIRWMQERGIECEFHDLKKERLEASQIKVWLEDIERHKLINKRGLTWRKISIEDKFLSDETAIIALIQSNPTVVKRPVVFNGQFWSVGFSEETWDKLFL